MTALREILRRTSINVDLPWITRGERLARKLRPTLASVNETKTNTNTKTGMELTVILE